MTEYDDPIPRSFGHWRYCIEHWCGIKLTREYAEERILALEDPNDEHTRRFIDCHGKAHHRAVVGWFRQMAGQ